MLRLKVEHVPFGDESQAELLDEIIIRNDGTGSHEFGHYAITSRQVQGEFYIKNHYRPRGFWPLVQELAKRMGWSRPADPYSNGKLRVAMKSMQSAPHCALASLDGKV